MTITCAAWRASTGRNIFPYCRTACAGSLGGGGGDQGDGQPGAGVPAAAEAAAAPTAALEAQAAAAEACEAAATPAGGRGGHPRYHAGPRQLTT
jgi:hypothetical protein